MGIGSPGRIGGDQDYTPYYERQARSPFAEDPAALAAFNRAQLESGYGRDSRGRGAGIIGGTGELLMQDLQRRQGAVGTSNALAQRGNPFAALRRSQRSIQGIDFAGARDEAVGRALEQYRLLLAQKKSRDIALMQAQQQLSDQYLGAGTAAVGSLLSTYAASQGRDRNA